MEKLKKGENILYVCFVNIFERRNGVSDYEIFLGKSKRERRT